MGMCPPTAGRHLCLHPSYHWLTRDMFTSEGPGLALVTLGIWLTCDGRCCILITWTSTYQALVLMPSPSSSHLPAPQFAVHPSVWDSGPFSVLTARARASPREL